MFALLSFGCDGEMGPMDSGATDASPGVDAGPLADAGPDVGLVDAGSDSGPPGAPCDRDEVCDAAEFCDFSVERCRPDACDPASTTGGRICADNRVQQCRANGSGYDVTRSCMEGRVCVALDTAPYADCRCVSEGQLACESPSLGADVYEVDSCGTRVRRIQDCVVAARESCVSDERGVRCSAPETCTASANCASSDYCFDGRCVPDVCIPPPISNPNSRRFCDGNVVRVCAEDGSGFVEVESCGGGQICVTLPSDPGADCRCAAAGTACNDTDRWVFDSCGAFTSRVQSCDGSLECVEGPSGSSCELRTTCTRDTDCVAGRLCDAGRCVPRVCTAGSARCTGARAERCDDRGTAWTPIDDCVGGEVCVMASGSASCVCTASASLGCATGDVYDFDSCGVRGARATDCTGTSVCVGGPSGPSCVDASTPPMSCVGDIDCGAGQICLDTLCSARVCAPNASFCEAGAARRCDSRGAGSVLLDDCDGGQTCGGSSGGEARCTCVVGARLGCSAGDVYQFDSCGGRGSITQDCTGSCIESAGSASCVTPPLTVPPAPSCAARASSACYLGDLYWYDSCGVPGEIREDCAGAVRCNTIGGPPACRSSVADMSSPYWERSCPLVQDVELQTDLPADCRCFINRTPLGGIDRCTGALYVPPSTRIGTGPSLRVLPQASFNGGVVLGRELFVGAGWSSAARPRQGLVMAVHLDTADRRIVSGAYDDPSTGFAETGTGRSFARVIDVQSGPDGNLYALSVPATSPDLEIIRVSPTTGARTLVWKGRDASFGQCASGDPARLAVTYHDRVFGITPAGEFYLAFRGAGFYSEGVGLVRIAADGASCSFVTRSGAGSLSAHRGADIGGGYELDRGYYGGLVQHTDGNLYTLNDVYKALFRIDPTTGARTRVSSAATSWGLLGDGPANFGGIGQRWLTWDSARSIMWATGLLSYRGLTAIDLANGNRTEAYCRSSNPLVPWRDTCLGGVLEGGYQNEGGFWIDPANGDPILVHEAHGIVRVDLENGNSMRISF